MRKYLGSFKEVINSRKLIYTNFTKRLRRASNQITQIDADNKKKMLDRRVDDLVSFWYALDKNLRQPRCHGVLTIYSVCKTGSLISRSLASYIGLRPRLFPNLRAVTKHAGMSTRPCTVRRLKVLSNIFPPP